MSHIKNEPEPWFKFPRPDEFKVESAPPPRHCNFEHYNRRNLMGNIIGKKEILKEQAEELFNYMLKLEWGEFIGVAGTAYATSALLKAIDPLGYEKRMKECAEFNGFEIIGENKQEDEV